MLNGPLFSGSLKKTLGFLTCVLHWRSCRNLKWKQIDNDKKKHWQRQPPKRTAMAKKWQFFEQTPDALPSISALRNQFGLAPLWETTWSPYFRNHMTQTVTCPIKHVPRHQILSTLSLSLSLSTWSNAAIPSAPPILPIALPDTKRPKQKGGPTSDLKQIDFPILDARFVFNTGNPEILTTESNQPKTPQTIRNQCVFWMPAWRFWIANPKSRNLNPEPKFHPCCSINNPIPSKLRSTCHLKYLWISNCDDVHLRCLFEAIWNGKKWEPTQHVVSTFILHLILNLYGGIVRKFLLRQCWIK